MMRYGKSKNAFRDPKVKILLVLGTGRSGTHFLTQCLIGNDQIVDFMNGSENKAVFPLVTEAAVDRSIAPTNLRKVRRFYVSYAKRATPNWFVDQSHPNIWHAEMWAACFPSARFVGIVRNPYAVVASMLRHRGVRRWVEEWEKYPLPNDFLGITLTNTTRYRTMTITERCTLRWVAHYRRLQELRSKLGLLIHVVKFEHLCKEPHAALMGVADMIAVEKEFTLPRIDLGAMTKYRDMTSEDICSIENILTEEGLHETVLREWPDCGS